MRNAPAIQFGFSLAELLLVVALLALIAAVAVPGFDKTDSQKLDAATRIFGDAIRYARNESMRAGAEYGVRHDTGKQRLRVFRLDRSTNPPTQVHDVYHPVDKSKYDIRLDKISFAAADTVVQSTTFDGICNSPDRIYFDGHGVARCAEPDNVLLLSFRLDLVLGAAQKSVLLDGRTGRVTSW